MAADPCWRTGPPPNTPSQQRLPCSPSRCPSLVKLASHQGCGVERGRARAGQPPRVWALSPPRVAARAPRPARSCLGEMVESPVFLLPLFGFFNDTLISRRGARYVNAEAEDGNDTDTDEEEVDDTDLEGSSRAMMRLLFSGTCQMCFTTRPMPLCASTSSPPSSGFGSAQTGACVWAAFNKTSKKIVSIFHFFATS